MRKGGGWPRSLQAMAGVVALTAALGAQQAGARRSGRGPQAPPLRITVSGFADGAEIPIQFTCSAQPAAVSPAVSWTQVPPGTQSFILLVHDPEAHPGKGVMDVTHWLIWNIPGSARALPQGVPAGATLSDGSHQISMRAAAYMGPCPPAGPNHHYTWQLFALDTSLDLPADATREQVMSAADGHVLGAAEWIGLFHR